MKKLYPMDIVCVAIFSCFLFVILCGKYIAPYSATAVDIINRFGAFTIAHPLGTDQLGRDILSRVVVGARATLLTSFLILLISLAIGTVLGLVSGYAGGKIDWFIMRLVDAAMVFPDYVIAILIAGILGGGMFNLVVATVFVKWFPYCRITRSIVLSEKQKDYITVAKIDGMKTSSILGKHLLPYITGSVGAYAVIDIGKIILLIASLSYLGLGIQPPTPEWGAMLNDGRENFSTHSQLMIIPGLAICISVFAFNYLGSYISKRLNMREMAGEQDGVA
jgi:peptide/nickel transport system permease protein